MRRPVQGLNPACKLIPGLQLPWCSCLIIGSPHRSKQRQGYKAYMASAVLAPSIISSLLAHTGQPPATGAVPAEVTSHLKGAFLQLSARGEFIPEGYQWPSLESTTERIEAERAFHMSDRHGNLSNVLDTILHGCFA